MTDGFDADKIRSCGRKVDPAWRTPFEGDVSLIESSASEGARERLDRVLQS